MPLFPRQDPRFQVLYDVHAWIGLTAGLALYIMFLTGIVGLGVAEIESWEQPAHHDVAQGDLDRWWAALDLRDATSVVVLLPDPERGLGAPRAHIELAHTENRYVWRTDRWVPTGPTAGEFLFRLHFLYHPALPWLYDLAGWLSVTLLVAIGSGVLIHLRDLPAQVQRFRAALPPRIAWADLHKVTATLALPFQVLFAWTGAILVLGNYLVAGIGLGLYAGDQDRARDMAFGPEPAPALASPPNGAASAWVAAANDAVPGLVPTRIRWHRPNTDGQQLLILGPVPGSPGQTVVHLHPQTLSVLRVVAPGRETPPAAAQRWLFALHFADYGGASLKVAYAVLAVATGATLLTGNALWLARRAQLGPTRVDAVLRVLTVGIGAGLPWAMAATWAASRLRDEAGTVEAAFLSVLLISCLVAVPASARIAASWLLVAGAVTFLSLPVFQLAHSRAGLFGDRTHVGSLWVEGGFLVVSLALAFAAVIAARGVRVWFGWRKPRPEVAHG
jgi:uncharacterized iron-regulated membrane protein